MSVEYKNFKASEMIVLMNAITKATELSNRAWIDNLKNKSWNETLVPAYNSWFGEVSKIRFDKVKRNISIVNYALHSQKITWKRVKDDPKNYAAALMPKGGWNEQKVKEIIDTGYTVEIDDLFFGTTDEERFNTILHEVSHIVANTDDEIDPDTHQVAYGKVSCTNLKNNYPDIAINNADNYGYFHLDFH